MAERTETIRQLVREAIAEARGAQEAQAPSGGEDAPGGKDASAGKGAPVRIPVVIRDSADAGRLAQLIAAIAASPALGPRLGSGAIAFDARLATGDDGQGAGHGTGPGDGAAEAASRAAFDRFFAAFNSGDFDLVWATVTDDFEWRLPGGPDAPYTSARGKAAFRKAYTARWAFLRHFTAVNEAVFVSGDRVYQHYRVSGTGPDGAAVDFTGLDFYIVRDGRIALKDAFNKSVLPAAAKGDARRPAAAADTGGVITERKVVEAARRGARLAIGRHTAVTPLARDRARALGLAIERTEP